MPVSCVRPFLAGGDRKGAGERSGGHDFARGERRALRILRQRLDEMTQRKERPVEDIRGGARDRSGRSVAEKIDLETRELAAPIRRVAAPPHDEVR